MEFSSSSSAAWSPWFRRQAVMRSPAWYWKSM